MESRIQDDQVRRRVPGGRELPARFDDFLRAKPPFAVEWNGLGDYGLRRAAEKEAVPFLRLPDGGLVALWYHATSPAVVHIGGHGEAKVIARDFDDFLKAVAVRCSGLPDFDDADRPFRVPGVKGRPAAGLPELQEQFDGWLQRHSSLQRPVETPDAEALRQRVHRIAVAMIRDGRSKVYTPASPWWSMNFQAERTETGVAVTYLDFGAWYPVPGQYELGPAVAELLKLVKHPKRGRYELSVDSAGTVSVDRDRELVLVPPGTASG